MGKFNSQCGIRLRQKSFFVRGAVDPECAAACLNLIDQEYMYVLDMCKRAAFSCTVYEFSQSVGRKAADSFACALVCAYAHGFVLCQRFYQFCEELLEMPGYTLQNYELDTPFAETLRKVLLHTKDSLCALYSDPDELFKQTPELVHLEDRFLRSDRNYQGYLKFLLDPDCLRKMDSKFSA